MFSGDALFGVVAFMHQSRQVTGECQVCLPSLAVGQLDLTRRQIDAGVLAPSDLIGSESTVASRELSLVRSETDLEAAMDRLRQILNLPESEWKQVLIASDEPTTSPREVDLETAMRDALRSRPEAKQNEIRQKQSELSLRIAENNQLPSLNVGFRYGVAGQSNVFSGAVEQLQGLGARNWGVFVNLNWTPLSRANRANRDIARSSERQRELRYQQFIVNLRTEIRGALRRLESAERQVIASEKFRRLSERSLDAERRRFLNGKSRNLEVSRREDELARAQAAELSAQIAFLKAASDLDLATGKLLERKKIRIGIR